MIITHWQRFAVVCILRHYGQGAVDRIGDLLGLANEVTVLGVMQEGQ